MDKDIETTRMQLWADAWVQVANASNCTNMSSPTSWADEALAQFDERFKEEDDG